MDVHDKPPKPSSEEAAAAPLSTAISSESAISNCTTNGTLLADIHSLLHVEEVTDISLIPTPSSCAASSSNDNSITSVPAIKAILAARSAVFRRMLYGEFCETARSNSKNIAENVEVQLDYSGRVLQLLVEFCFTDQLASLNHGEDGENGGKSKDGRNNKYNINCNNNGGAISLEEKARLLTNLSGAAHYFDIPKLESDIKKQLSTMMLDHPSLACAILDESSKILPGEEIGLLAMDRIRARPKAALLPWMHGVGGSGEIVTPSFGAVNNNHDSTTRSWEGKGGVIALSASLLEQVIFDEKSSASELTKFHCLRKWVQGCNHEVSMEELELPRKQSEDDILSLDQSRAPSPPTSPPNKSSFRDGKFEDEHHQQKLAIAKHLAQKLDLSLIPASDLSSTVNDSQLLSTHDLYQAYRLQALNAERVKSKVIVEGAGLAEVNGTYIQGGVHEGTPMYNKEGVWKDREEVFRIFMCTYSNGNKSWCISIVPKGKEPGKTTDVDFYECPVSYGKGIGGGPLYGMEMGVVPSRGWKLVSYGQPPVPRASLISVLEK